MERHRGHREISHVAQQQNHCDRPGQRGAPGHSESWRGGGEIKRHCIEHGPLSVMTHELSKRKLSAFVIGLILFSDGCASRVSPPSTLPAVTALDNLNGASQPSVAPAGDDAVRIEAASRVGECVLREFLVEPSDRTLPSKGRVHGERPQGFLGDRAILRFKPSEPTTIIAQYVHAVVVESGSRSEPQGELNTTGSGEM